MPKLMNEKGIAPIVIGFIAIAAILGGMGANAFGILGAGNINDSCGLATGFHPCKEGLTCADNVCKLKIGEGTKYFFDSMKLGSLLCGQGLLAGACNIAIPLVAAIIGAIIVIILGIAILGVPMPQILYVYAGVGTIIGLATFNIINIWWWAFIIAALFFGILIYYARQ